MNIVITAGGTEERIDSVRKITNISTGLLGSIICNKFIDYWFNNLSLIDNHIFYVCNKNSVKPEASTSVSIIETSDTNSVKEVIEDILKNNKIDSFIHSMAISDYTVEGAYISGLNETLNKINTGGKMKSDNDEVYLRLVRTPKIIDSIKKISPSTLLISFKLLNDVPEDELIQVARKQMRRTNSSLVVANDLKFIKEGNHKAIMINESGNTIVNSKESIASYIVDFHLNLSMV